MKQSNWNRYKTLILNVYLSAMWNTISVTASFSLMRWSYDQRYWNWQLPKATDLVSTLHIYILIYTYLLRYAKSEEEPRSVSLIGNPQVLPPSSIIFSLSKHERFMFCNFSWDYKSRHNGKFVTAIKEWTQGRSSRSSPLLFLFQGN